MKKIFLFAVVALMSVACNSNAPESKQQLVGIWSEPYHVKDAVQEFTFNENGTLIYIHKHDSTWTGIVHQWAPSYADLQYSVTNDEKLRISGKGRTVDIEAQTVDSVNFTFVTDYTIKGNTLTIDSFSYDGGLLSRFYYNIKLEKQ